MNSITTKINGEIESHLTLEDAERHIVTEFYINESESKLAEVTDSEEWKSVRDNDLSETNTRRLCKFITNNYDKYSIESK